MGMRQSQEFLWCPREKSLGLKINIYTPNNSQLHKEEDEKACKGENCLASSKGTNSA